MNRTGRGTRRSSAPSTRAQQTAGHQPLGQQPAAGTGPRARPADQTPSLPSNDVRDVSEHTQMFQRVAPNEDPSNEASGQIGRVRPGQSEASAQVRPGSPHASAFGSGDYQSGSVSPNSAPHRPVDGFVGSRPGAAPETPGVPPSRMAISESTPKNEIDAGPATQAFHLDAAATASGVRGQSTVAGTPDVETLGSQGFTDSTQRRNLRSQDDVRPSQDGRVDNAQARRSGAMGQDLSERGDRQKTKKPLPASSRRPPKKPSEPTKAVLAIALSTVAVVFLGVAAFLFFRGGDDEEAASPTVAEGTEANDGETQESPTPDSTVSSETPSGGGPSINVADNAAALGPLPNDTEYTMVAEGVAEGSTLRYVVDGQAQGEPFTELPPLRLEPGRHTVALEQTVGDQVSVGGAIAVYVLGPTPGKSVRANLKSVSIESEGWAEAVKQYDLLLEDHPNLTLTPSNPYASLTPGFWNLYVDGFATSEEAAAYCEKAGLTVPDDCFPKAFDPQAPAAS